MSAAAVRFGTLAGLGEQVLSVLATLVATRLLAPDQVGLVAAAQAVAALVGVLSSLGIGLALVRRDEVRRSDVSTALALATAVGLTCAGLLALLHGSLTSLLGVDDAGSLVLVLTPLALLRALAAVPRALLLREGRGSVVYGLQLLGTAAYLGCQTVLLLAGSGPRAVVLGQVVGAGTLLVALWLAARPDWRAPVAGRQLAADLRDGARLVVAAAAVQGSRNVDFLLVGKVLGPASLGAYYVAFVLPNVLRQRVTWVVGELLVARMAREDPAGVLRLYRSALLVGAVVGWPPMLLLACTGGPVVHLAFGDGWDDAVAPLGILALASALDFLSPGGSSALLATGRTGHQLGNALRRLVLVAAGATVALVTSSDLRLVAVGVAVGIAVAVLWQLDRVCRLLGSTAATELASLRPLVLPCLALSAAATAGTRVPAPDLVQLVTASVGAGVAFLAAARSSPRAWAALTLAAGVVVPRWDGSRRRADVP